MLKKKPLGLILWKGKSLLDGERIMVITTGVFNKSANSKTGDMIQTWIMRRDINPMLARRLGEDKSICGNCKLKECGACYVNLRSPITIYNAYQDGRYRDYTEKDNKYFIGRNIRIGSYGDPAAVPYEIWENISKVAKSINGYSHQWRTCDQRLRNLCMASVDSIDGYLQEYEKAKSMGWRSFRVFADNDGKSVYDEKQENEFICPASKEAGVKTDCNHCGACGGFSSRTDKDVLINLHGDSDSLGHWRKDRFIKTMKKIKNKKGWRRDYTGERKIFRAVCKF